MRKGWKIKKLADVCWKITDGSHNPPKGIEHSNYIMLSSKNIIDGKITFENPRYLNEKDFEIENRRTDVSTNDILLTIVGTIGRTAVVPQLKEKITLQRSVAVLKPDAKLVNPFYLKLILDHIVLELQQAARGVAQKGIYLSQLRKITIPIPSLLEQQRIVKILDTAFTKIDTIKQNTERNLQNAKELFKNISNSIFDELSQEERVKKLGEVCDFVRGPFGGSLKKNCFKDKGYPVYEQQHAIYNKFVFRYYIDEDKFQEMKRFEVFPNDILMSCSGTLGKISIVPKNAPQGIINQALLKLTVKKGLLNTYLKAWMESFSFQESLNNYSKGAAIQNVASVKILKDISIHLPSIDKQHQIVTKLNALSIKSKELENNYRQTITDCDEMKKSILAKAFNGEL